MTTGITGTANPTSGLDQLLGRLEEILLRFNYAVADDPLNWRARLSLLTAARRYARRIQLTAEGVIELASSTDSEISAAVNASVHVKALANASALDLVAVAHNPTRIDRYRW